MSHFEEEKERLEKLMQEMLSDEEEHPFADSDSTEYQPELETSDSESSTYYGRQKKRRKGLLWLLLLQYGHMVLSLEPGFLDFDNLPDTNFTCVGKVIGGYYADLETNCQMFHVCTIGQAEEPMDIRFLCLNGTVFDQETRVCERIDEVDCSKSERFYSLNLELYGNTGPILEETPEVPQETEPPSLIIKLTTSTTTTTSATTMKSASNPPYYTTARSSTATTPQPQPPTVTGHHFPANSDIRFNPEEINISLNPGAPPDIRTNRFGILSDSSKALVNHNNNNNRHEEEDLRKPQLVSSTSKTIYAIDASDSVKLPQNSDSFDFDDAFATTNVPVQQQHQQFLIQTNSFRHSQSYPQNNNLNSQYHQPQFHYTTIKHFGNYNHDHTTSRTIYLPAHKPPHIHQHHQFTHHTRTEKTPQRVQIPIPLIPTLPPLTFSSPAPFSLQRHVETKRYIKEHASPPRIIISASASVSDASGRRLNYSLGTIGAHNILETPPSSYDDYKDGDVGLDPFYHDVPKVKQRRRRRKRSTSKGINPFDIIKNEKEAVEVLKFLYTWYQSHQATATVPPVTSPNYAMVDISDPVTPELIKKINELAPVDETIKAAQNIFKDVEENDKINLNTSNKNVKFIETSDEKTKNITADTNSNNQFAKDTIFNEKMDNIETIFTEDAGEQVFNPNESVDDNYESEIYKHVEKDKEIVEEDKYEKYIKEITTKKAIETILSNTKSEEVFNDKSTSNAEWSIKNDFDPNDYVDDNYEPIVYKEAEDKTDKDNELEKIMFSKPEEKDINNKESNNKEILNDEDKAKNIILSKEINTTKETTYFTNPGVSELYKYFNVKNSLTTEDSRLDDVTTTENILISQSEPDVSSKIEEEVKKSSNDYTVKENVNIATTSEPYDFSSLNIQFATEESTTSTSTPSSESNKNILSEHESFPTKYIDENNSLKNNSEQTEINILFEINEGNQTDTSTTTISPPKYTVRKRGRGRQRFNDSQQEASFKSDISKNHIRAHESKNYISDPIRTIKHRGRSRFSLANNLQSTSPASKPTITTSHTTSTTTVASSSTYLSNFEVVTLATQPSTLQSTSDEIVSKQDGLKIEIYRLNKPNKYAFLDSGNNSSKNLTNKIENGIAENQNITEVEDLSNNNKTSVADSSYGIQLLRYFAQSVLEEENIPTEPSAVSYEPITEIETTTTPVYVTPVHKINYKSHQVKNNRKYSRHRHSTRVSTTELPTLRDINDNTNLVNEKKHDIDLRNQFLEKLSNIEQNSEESSKQTTTDLSIIDTTVTTPLSYDEESESFGTTVLSMTEPTNQAQYTTQEPDRTETFVTDVLSTTERYKNYLSNLFDDVFIVPELKNANSTSDGAKIDENMTEATTENLPSLPDVEIQKSISLPISVLQTSYSLPYDHNNVQDINSVANNEINNTDRPTTLLESPSTETTIFDPTTLTTEHITETIPTTLWTTQEPLHNTTKVERPKETPGMIHSSHLYQILIENTTSDESGTLSTTTASPYPTRRTRPTRRRPQGKEKNKFGRHRFSTELFTTKRPNMTDTPLPRSASPTRADLKKVSLITTPLSSKGSNHREPTRVGKNYVFNCFGKDINKFYADPRDCRLFHYCTNGYSKNQLLDLKYVCDQKTFFDEDKLICSKIKPEKCL